MILPPKRFEGTEDPKYDPIRHRPWFKKLEKRRLKLYKLKQAVKNASFSRTQQEVAKEFGVDTRELRDYLQFICGSSRVPTSQKEKYFHCLGYAYDNYKSSNGGRSFTWHIKKVAPLYGITPRRIVEAWEIDPSFIPANYAE